MRHSNKADTTTLRVPLSQLRARKALSRAIPSPGDLPRSIQPLSRLARGEATGSHQYKLVVCSMQSR